MNRGEALKHSDPLTANREKGSRLPEPSRSIRIERRAAVRFPIRASARYRSVGKQGGIQGSVRCLNLSNNGLLVRFEHPVKIELRVGSRLEVVLQWPFAGNGAKTFELVVTGRVLRRRNSTVALSVERYRLQTMKRKSGLSANLEDNKQHSEGPSTG